MPQTIPFEVQEITEAVVFTVGSEPPIDLAAEQVRIVYEERPAYTGSYTVTPTESAQTLATNDKRMTGDVTVNPIPVSYGFITAHTGYLEIT